MRRLLLPSGGALRPHRKRRLPHVSRDDVGLARPTAAATPRAANTLHGHGRTRCLDQVMHKTESASADFSLREDP